MQSPCARQGSCAAVSCARVRAGTRCWSGCACWARACGRAAAAPSCSKTTTRPSASRCGGDRRAQAAGLGEAPAGPTCMAAAAGVCTRFDGCLCLRPSSAGAVARQADQGRPHPGGRMGQGLQLPCRAHAAVTSESCSSAALLRMHQGCVVPPRPFHATQFEVAVEYDEESRSWAEMIRLWVRRGGAGCTRACGHAHDMPTNAVPCVGCCSRAWGHPRC